MIRLVALGAGLVVSMAPGISVSAQACSESWALEETLRVGSVSGDDALSWVLDLTLGADGALYVAQQYTPAVTVFDSGGRPSNRIGRAGSGPGEIDGWPVALGWLGDTLWVADHSTVNFYGPDRQPVGQIYFHEVVPAQASILMPGAPLADGTVVPRRGATTSGGGSFEAFFGADSMPILRVSPDGEVLGEIGAVRNRLHVRIPTSSGGYGYALHPLDPGGDADRYVISPDGSAVFVIGAVHHEGPTSSFELLKLGLGGDTLMIRRIPFEPRDLTRSSRAWLQDEFGKVQAGDYASDSREFGQRGQAARERDRRAAMDAITFPEFMPPVRRLVAGEDGTVWLLRELEPPELLDRWEVYGPEGVFEGSIVIEEGRGGSLPWDPRLRVLRASRDEVWGVTLGEFDEPYIHRYRVRSQCEE